MGVAAGAIAAAAAGIGAGLLMNKQMKKYDAGASEIPAPVDHTATIPKSPALPTEPAKDNKAATEAEDLVKKQAALREQESPEIMTSPLGIGAPAYSQKRHLLGA